MFRIRRVSIVTRIAAAVVVSLLLFAATMLVFIKSEFEQAIYAETDARVQAAQNTYWQLVRAKGTPTLVNGQLRLGRWLANDDNSLVDDVHHLTDADATLFAILNGKPIRVATTILKLDGSGRNMHTELLGPARTAFDVGQSFAGISPVAGRPFLNRYDALRDANGRVVGIVYTGIPLTSMAADVNKAMRTIIIATVIALVGMLCLLYLVMRPLKRAFRSAVTMAQGLAGGDVDQHSDAVSRDELGDVSLAFQEMIKYQQRMASIADALASGDFSGPIVPVSSRDRLGHAFAHMSDQLNRLVQQLETSAMTDSLTQIGNRRAFDVCMRRELSRAARRNGVAYLALLDVDGFKSVNDENGHQHGDVVLAKLGTMLRGFRAEDGAYRLGGDEFAVVLTDCSREEAMAAMERFRMKAQAELFGTTLSIGLASSPQGQVDAETLLRQADAALYVCKQRGRNIVVAFEDVRVSNVMSPQVNVQAVSQMIANRDLVAAFQPIVDLDRQVVLGFEALARPDEKYGFPGPREVFDAAAKMGRTHDLDRACRDVAIAGALNLPKDALLFLNVAPESLARGELTSEPLIRSLAKVGISVDRVVLEITERYSGSLEAVIDGAQQLQRDGFKIALDDTGAGNSGLEFLSRFRFDFIKIDGTIIANAGHDLAARGVISAIVALAKTTGAYVIAEGIEDEEMLAMVSKKLNGVPALDAVNGVQGYFLGRPGSLPVALSGVA
jgi:diguanylate cyclase (GGDEF)-like protein